MGAFVRRESGGSAPILAWPSSFGGSVAIAILELSRRIAHALHVAHGVLATDTRQCCVNLVTGDHAAVLAHGLGIERIDRATDVQVRGADLAAAITRPRCAKWSAWRMLAIGSPILGRSGFASSSPRSSCCSRVAIVVAAVWCSSDSPRCFPTHHRGLPSMWSHAASTSLRPAV